MNGRFFSLTYVVQDQRNLYSVDAHIFFILNTTLCIGQTYKVHKFYLSDLGILSIFGSFLAVTWSIFKIFKSKLYSFLMSHADHLMYLPPKSAVAVKIKSSLGFPYFAPMNENHS